MPEYTSTDVGLDTVASEDALPQVKPEGRLRQDLELICNRVWKLLRRQLRTKPECFISGHTVPAYSRRSRLETMRLLRRPSVAPDLG